MCVLPWLLIISIKIIKSKTRRFCWAQFYLVVKACHKLSGCCWFDWIFKINKSQSNASMSLTDAYFIQMFTIQHDLTFPRLCVVVCLLCLCFYSSKTFFFLCIHVAFVSDNSKARFTNWRNRYWWNEIYSGCYFSIKIFSTFRERKKSNYMLNCCYEKLLITYHVFS